MDGPYQVNGTMVKGVCKPVNACYKFRLETTDDASGVIFLDEKEIGTATTTNIVPCRAVVGRPKFFDLIRAC